MSFYHLYFLFYGFSRYIVLFSRVSLPDMTDSRLLCLQNKNWGIGRRKERQCLFVMSDPFFIPCKKMCTHDMYKHFKCACTWSMFVLKATTSFKICSVANFQEESSAMKLNLTQQQYGSIWFEQTTNTITRCVMPAAPGETDAHQR